MSSETVLSIAEPTSFRLTFRPVLYWGLVRGLTRATATGFSGPSGVLGR